MSEGLSDQRVALIVLGVLLLLAGLLCFMYPWVNRWANERNRGTKNYKYWLPWRYADNVDTLRT